ncbi:MAG: hypothetical protein ACI3W9_01355 [Eubacteriales bacterium]
MLFRNLPPPLSYIPGGRYDGCIESAGGIALPELPSVPPSCPCAGYAYAVGSGACLDSGSDIPFCALYSRNTETENGTAVLGEGSYFVQYRFTARTLMVPDYITVTPVLGGKAVTDGSSKARMGREDGSASVTDFFVCVSPDGGRLSFYINAGRSKTVTGYSFSAAIIQI